jgi:hypothetical protein
MHHVYNTYDKMKTQFPKFVWIIALIALSTRLMFVFSLNQELKLNPDEQRNYEIANNRLCGNGYSVFDSNKQQYVLTAFHGSFTVFVYQFLIQHNVPLKNYVLFIWILTIVCFLVSIFSFYNLTHCFFDTIPFYRNISVTLYAFYPSVLIYIGSLFFYENMVLSLLIILMSRVLLFDKKTPRLIDFILAIPLISFCCLLRPQVLPIFSLLLLIVSIRAIIKRNYTIVLFTIQSIIIVSLCFIPTLKKNKSMFGTMMLSTQGGFELLQGHNPTARGSWMGKWSERGNKLYEYSRAHINNLDRLNEYEESIQRKKLAIKWIMENPLGELKLIFRKLAIYFYPTNYEEIVTFNWINPITLFVHLSFVFFITQIVFRFNLSYEQFLISLPIFVSIALSVLFFVGYRWRYYAEPFMVLFAVKNVELIVTKKKQKNQTVF